MEASVDAPAAPQGGFFARSASGLVREISLGSAIALNVSFISIVYAVLGATTVPFAFPGASLPLSAALCTVALICPYLMYSFFSRAMPRSGGDYVFVSRSIHPWVGLAAGINGALWYAFTITFASFLTIQFALSATLASVGTIVDNQTLVGWSTDVLKDGWTFVLALAVIAICLATVCMRLPRTLAITRGLFYVAVAGTAVAVIALLLGSRDEFEAAVAGTGTDYGRVISDAMKAGFTPEKTNFGDTALSITAPFYALGFGIATAYVSGEIRGGKDVATRGKLYSLAIAGVAMTITFGLAASVFGKDFLGGATLMSNTFDENYPFSAPSNVFFFVSLLSDSPVVAVILGITFLASAVAVIIPAFLIASRSLFAWSFDRLVPEKLSEVNERTRAPLVANFSTAAIAIVFLAVLVFGPSTLISVAATQILGLVFTFIITSIAAIVFPYRRRTIYEGSPIERSVGGIPLMSLIGAVSLCVYVFLAYAFITSDALAATTDVGLGALTAFGVIAVLAYPVSYLFNRRRGLDISLASRELPPE